MEYNLVGKVEKQITELKSLISQLSLTKEQRTRLYHSILTRNTMPSLPLEENLKIQLNREIENIHRLYKSAYEYAKSCPAVSEWMSDPIDRLANIWNIFQDKAII